jgi:hypothetical protein
MWSNMQKLEVGPSLVQMMGAMGQQSEESKYSAPKVDFGELPQPETKAQEPAIPMPTQKLKEEEDQHVKAMLKEANAAGTGLGAEPNSDEDDETEDMFALMNQIKNARESN